MHTVNSTGLNELVIRGVTPDELMCLCRTNMCIFEPLNVFFDVKRFFLLFDEERTHLVVEALKAETSIL